MPRLHLKIVKGERCGACFDFERNDNYLIGRDSDCHIPLVDDHFASRHHSVLRLKPTYVSIRDLGSCNGTYVNGQKYGGRNGDGQTTIFCLSKPPEVIINDGDQIRIGRTVFEVKIKTTVLCSECGCEVPGLNFDICVDLDIAVICAPCRARSAETALSDPSLPLRCQKCGKYVPQQKNAANRKDNLCRSCRAEMEASSLRFMRQVMKGIIYHKPGGAVPHISAYEIERELGLSGFGAIYLARRKADDNPVVIKVMTAQMANHNKKTQKKIRQEMTRNQFLQRPDTLEFVDHGVEGVTFCFIMELCEGESVDNLITKIIQPPVMMECC